MIASVSPAVSYAALTERMEKRVNYLRPVFGTKNRLICSSRGLIANGASALRGIAAQNATRVTSADYLLCVSAWYKSRSLANECIDNPDVVTGESHARSPNSRSAFRKKRKTGRR